MILQDLLHVVEGLELDGVEVLAHDMMKKQPVKGKNPTLLLGRNPNTCQKQERTIFEAYYTIIATTYVGIFWGELSKRWVRALGCWSTML